MRSHLKCEGVPMQNKGGNSHDDNACDIGFIGLGVMGSNLTMNLVDHGYRVACFDLDQNKVESILAKDGIWVLN